MVDYDDVVVDNKKVKSNKEWAKEILDNLKIERQECPFNADYDKINYYPNEEIFEEAANEYVDILHFAKELNKNKKEICSEKVVKKDDVSDMTSFTRNGATCALFMADGDPEKMVEWYREGYYANMEGGERFQKYVKAMLKKVLEFDPNDIDRSNKKDILKELYYTTTVGLMTSFLQLNNHQLENELKEKRPQDYIDLDKKIQSTFNDQVLLFRMVSRVRYDLPSSFVPGPSIYEDPSTKNVFEYSSSNAGIYNNIQFAKKIYDVSCGDNKDMNFILPPIFSGNAFGRSDFEYDPKSAQNLGENLKNYDYATLGDYDADNMNTASPGILVTGTTNQLYDSLVSLYAGQGEVYEEMADRLLQNDSGIVGSNKGIVALENSLFINGVSLRDLISKAAKKNNITPNNRDNYLKFHEKASVAYLASALQDPEDVITMIMYKHDENYNVVPVPVNIKKDYSSVIREASKLESNTEHKEANLQNVQNQNYEENKEKYKYMAILDYCVNNQKHIDSYNKEVGATLFENAKGVPYVSNKFNHSFVEGETKDAVDFYHELKKEKYSKDKMLKALQILRDINEKHNKRGFFGKYFKPSSYTMRNLMGEIKKDLNTIGLDDKTIDDIVDSKQGVAFEYKLENNISKIAYASDVYISENMPNELEDGESMDIDDEELEDNFFEIDNQKVDENKSIDEINKEGVNFK